MEKNVLGNNFILTGRLKLYVSQLNNENKLKA